VTIDEGEGVPMVITLPEGADQETVTKVIDLENVKASCGEQTRVHVAIGPWYATKDVD